MRQDATRVSSNLLRPEKYRSTAGKKWLFVGCYDIDGVENMGLGGNKKLKLIVSKWNGRVWTVSPGSGHRQIEGSCDHKDKHSGCIKLGECLEWPRAW
jgi:hypothetical protein